MTKKRAPAPAGRQSIEFPPMPFSLNMRVRVPTLTGEWEGNIAELLQVDVDHPKPQLAEASTLTAFWAFTRAFLRERALTQQGIIKRVEGRVKKRLLITPPEDAKGDAIRMTKDTLAIWIMSEPEHEQATADLRHTERLLEIAEAIMWECKAWHKDLQILTAARLQERGVEESTPGSIDPEKIRGGTRTSGRNRPHHLEQRLGVANQGEDEDAEES